ncbi:MAG: hypothetical protein ABL956_16070 [Hyphomonadaceae bacterium]
MISDVAISDEQIEGIVDATAPIIHAAFESNETFQRYAAAWIRRYPSDGHGILGGT